MGDAGIKRATCAICTNDRPLNQDGTFRAHRHGDGRCPGSGLSPGDAGRMAEVTLPPEPALTPEVVTDPHPRAEQPGTEVERAPRSVEHTDEARSAIEAAADAALMTPGVPGRDEFLTLAVTARMLSMSAAAPKMVRGDPHLVFHIALVGRDLGISPSAALELIDVLDTKAGPRLSLSPQLMNGQLRRLGLGSIRPLKRTMYECVAAAYGPDGELLGESEFTWEDAVIAGLADDRCEPNKHFVPNSGNGRCGCNQGYRSYAKRMLWWRAAGFGADDYFPEAGLGLYTPEALGAAVDEHGRPLDPATVELPDGYQASHGNGGARGVPADDRADGAALWELQARAWALPDEQKRQLRERREHSAPLRTDSGVIPFWQLSDRGLRVAKSLLAGFERAAQREHDGFDPEAATALVTEHCARLHLAAMTWAPQTPQDEPPAPQDPDPPAEPPADTQAADTANPELRATVESEVVALSVEDVETELRRTHGIDPTGMNPAMMRTRLIMAEYDLRSAAGG